MSSVPVRDLENVFNRIKSIWPQKSHFLITGGTGFFGRWVIEAIAYIEQHKPSGNHYIILSRQNPSNLKKKYSVLENSFFEIIQHDLAEPIAFDHSVDYLLHAATDVTNLGQKHEFDFNINIQATKNICDAVKNKKLKKFLFVSSGGVYENGESASEDSALKTNLSANSYGVSKIKSENLVKELSDVCIARCFSFVGPYAAPQMAVMQMLQQKKDEKPIEVKAPQVVRSYMYIADLVVSLFHLLLLQNQHLIYNIGSPQKITLKNLAEMIAELDTHQVAVLIGQDREATGLAGDIYFPNATRYDREYEAGVTTSLKDSLKFTLQFLKQSKTGET